MKSSTTADDCKRLHVPVAVLDLDPQASAAEWKDSRPGDSPSVTSIQSSRLRKALEESGVTQPDLFPRLDSSEVF